MSLALLHNLLACYWCPLATRNFQLIRYVVNLEISASSHTVFHSLSRYVDYFNLLCFDFKMFSNESESTMKIGHHSSLHFKESESPSDQQLTVVSTYLNTYVCTWTERMKLLQISLASLNLIVNFTTSWLRFDRCCVGDINYFVHWAE